jgi:hypothetical protein
LLPWGYEKYGRIAMSRCVLCGVQNVDFEGVCLHHTVGDRDWSIINRMFCDFVHRGIEPPKAPMDDDRLRWVLEEFEVGSTEMVAF